MFGKNFQVYGVQFKEKCAFVNQKKGKWTFPLITFLIITLVLIPQQKEGGRGL